MPTSGRTPSTPARRRGAGALALAPLLAAVAHAAEPPPRGLLPIPRYPGELASRDHLTGDWGGARTDLAQRGVTAELSFTQVAQSVLTGGLERGPRYGGKLDASFSFDLDRMGVLPGALVTARTESRYGRSVNRSAGTLLPLNDVLFFPITSPADEDIPVALTELRYTQFLSKEVGFFVGKFTTLGGDANEFAGGRGDTQFLAHSFTSASVTSLFNPYSTLGGGVILNLSPQLTLTSSLYASTDSSTTAGFDTLNDGLVWSTALAWQYRLGNLPGGAQGTVQYSFAEDFVDLSGRFVSGGQLRRPSTGESWVAFANLWQYLYTLDAPAGPIKVGNGRADLRGLGLFLRAGVSDADTNPVRWLVSGGLGGRGLIPSRDHDSFGIGYAYSDFRGPALLEDRLVNDGSSRFEAYYCFAITPAVELTLDLQHAQPVLRPVESPWVLGARLRVAF